MDSPTTWWVACLWGLGRIDTSPLGAEAQPAREEKDRREKESAGNMPALSHVPGSVVSRQAIRMARRRATRSSIGGCVENRFRMLMPRNGFTMKR